MVLILGIPILPLFGDLESTERYSDGLETGDIVEFSSGELWILVAEEIYGMDGCHIVPDGKSGSSSKDADRNNGSLSVLWPECNRLMRQFDILSIQKISEEPIVFFVLNQDGRSREYNQYGLLYALHDPKGILIKEKPDTSEDTIDWRFLKFAGNWYLYRRHFSVNGSDEMDGNDLADRFSWD